MNTPQTITDRIYYECDKALKAEIDVAAGVFCEIVGRGDGSMYAYELRELSSETKVNGFGMVEALKGIAFKGLRDRRREEAVHQFMQKVESLSAEVEELRNSIPQ